MTVLADAPVQTAPALAAAMREGSMAEHEAAENAPFMGMLLNGELVAQAYVDYLARYRAVYAALEDVVRAHAADPLVAALFDPALERLAAIDADLAHWAPAGVAPVLMPGDSPATDAYVARLRGLDWGGAIVAHHYTRYLGDLSGGQAIGRILDRTFELGGAGIDFYEFPAIAKPKPYKDGYRASLDGLELDAADVARVVEEVQVAFRLNQAIFLELGQNLDAYRR